MTYMLPVESEAGSIWRMQYNIGMFPDIPIEKFHYIGNSSLTGCYIYASFHISREENL